MYEKSFLSCFLCGMLLMIMLLGGCTVLPTNPPAEKPNTPPTTSPDDDLGESDGGEADGGDTVNQDPTLSSVVMNVGAKHTERNLTWYSQNDAVAEVRYAKSKNGKLPTKYSTVPATSQAASKEGYYSYKATLTGLRANSTYVYCIAIGDTVSPCYSFDVYGTNDGFSFAFVTDAQIQKESQGKRWDDTLSQIKTKFEGVSFLVSGGDQVSDPTSEENYGYFISNHLSTLAIATTVGPPHDSGVPYGEHFNLPNLSPKYGVGDTSSDYFYTYGDVLFMHLNVESREYGEHVDFLKKTIAANDDCIWRVVVLHYSFFTGSKNSTSDRVLEFKSALADDFCKLGIDLVLSGHDHIYSRSKLMLDGMTPSDDAVIDSTAVDPIGTLYLCGTPSAGGNYYDVIQHNDDPYIAYRSEEKDRNRKSIVIFDVSESELVLKAYFIDNAEPELFDTFVIKKSTAK